MIYLHYELFNISSTAAEAMGLDSTQMAKLKFASNKTRISLAKYDFDRVKSFYLPMLKQIPAGKRKYDPIDYVWTIPASAFVIIRQLIEHEGDPQCIVKHKDLYKDFIFQNLNKLNQDQASASSWHEKARESESFQAEAPEDFFKQSVVNTNPYTITDLENKLSDLIKPFAKFELNTREDFMRGYKIAARRYHPDLAGGSSEKMSELNSLWMQYKEML